MNNSVVRFVKRSPGEYKFNKLKGLFCIYKPPDMDLSEIYKKIKYHLVEGLNHEPCRPIEDIVKVDDDSNQIFVSKNPADSVEAIGYRYKRKDFFLDFLHPLTEHDSGVVIASVNDSSDLLKKIENLRLMRVYEIKGRLGVFTDNFTPYGRLVDRTTYSHVNRSKVDRVMASIQAVYQRQMFRYFGLNLSTQEAFEMASKGLLRPKDSKTPPMIYSIRCIEFDRPYFKIEIHIINENVSFLRNLINDIGIRLKTYAICVGIRRTRDGFASFDEDCLAFNEWDFDEVYENSLKITKKANDYLIKHKDKLDTVNIKAD